MTDKAIQKNGTTKKINTRKQQKLPRNIRRKNK